MKKTLLLITGTILAAMMAFSQGTITIDASKQYQTIEGLGGFGPDNGVTDAFVKHVVDILGCTAFRMATPPDFINSAANLTSGTINASSSGMAANVSFANKVKAKGQQLIISTTWTPPAWMKQNNCECQKWGGICCNSPCGTYNCPDTTNYLKTSEFANYGKYLDLYCKDFKTKTGFDVYALCIQNEPMFNEPYGSALLYAPRFAAAMRTIGARFAADPALSGIKFYGGEHMCTYAGNNGGQGDNSKYIPYLMDDASTRQYMHAFAVHGYVDGMSLDIGSSGDWASFASKTEGYGKKMWMTETGFANGTWSNFMNSAKGLFLALKYGHVSLWTYWVLEDNLYASGSPDGRTAIGKQFFRFIRPGAVQVDATDAAKDFISMAFKNGNDWTIMMLNGGSTEVSINLAAAAGTSLPTSFQRYQSTYNNYCSYLGKTTSNTLVIPASSITTLYYSASQPDVQWSNNPPENVTVTNVTETSAKLSWTAAPAWTMSAQPSNYSVATNGYYVYRKETNGTWTKLNTSGAQTTLFYNLTGLKKGTKYTYAVQARDEFSNLSQFVEISFTTPCTTDCPDTTTIEIASVNTALTVYPNPCNDFVTLSTSDKDDSNGMNVEVTDLSGKVMLKIILYDGKLDVSALNPGVYLVRANSYVTKLIKR